jgi:polyisoprenoid-binding protein YceI
MTNRSILTTLSLSASLLACPNPADKAPKAKVGETKKAATPKAAAPASAPAPGAAAPDTAAAPGETKKLAIDASASKVEWVGSKVTGNHPGGFKTFSGTIDFDAANIENSKVSIDIDTTSVFSDNEKLTGHLKSADFFDVEKHPKATFAVTQVAKSGDGYKLIGTLDLRGVKREIEFPAKITVTDAAVNATAEFSINRKDFGIVYKGKPDDLIRDDVLIKLDVTAPRS